MDAKHSNHDRIRDTGVTREISEGSAVAWFSKRKRTPRRTPSRRLPKRDLAPVEDIVEQGLLVADVAVRMTVKNEIIMNALKRRVDYDEQQIIDMVRAAVIEVADERENDANHIAHMRGEIRDHGRSAWSETEYGMGDSRTLRHREQVYTGVAAELRARATDEEYVRATAERAKASAWAEIGNSLKDRAEEPYYGGGNTDEYAEARDARIQLLIEKDLTALVREAKKSKRS